jgi:hypothetical protein
MGGNLEILAYLKVESQDHPHQSPDTNKVETSNLKLIKLDSLQMSLGIFILNTFLWQLFYAGQNLRNVIMI